MKKIVVASGNPVKINAATIGFKKMFPNKQFEVTGVSVASGVRDQPQNDAETYRGAYNRMIAAAKLEPTADFLVGIEGGIQETNSEIEVFAWVIVQSKNGIIGKAKTATFILPVAIADLIRQGKELGEADDIVFGRKNSKQSNGAVGILTNDAITRAAYYVEAVILALLPFQNPELYKK